MTSTDYKCPYCKSENIDWSSKPVHGTKTVHRAWCEDCQEDFNLLQSHDAEETA